MEEPIITSFFLSSAVDFGDVLGLNVMAGLPGLSPLRMSGRRAEAAKRIFSPISDATDCRSRDMGPEGLEIKSTAPNESALRVVSEPLAVLLLNMTTGNGLVAIIWRKVSNPSITGISTSSVTTSTSNRCNFSRASLPLRA